MRQVQLVFPNVIWLDSLYAGRKRILDICLSNSSISWSRATFAKIEAALISATRLSPFTTACAGIFKSLGSYCHQPTQSAVEFLKILLLESLPARRLAGYLSRQFR